MSRRIVVPAGALLLLLLSGCCRFFGICTSVSVHTSISPDRPYREASASDYFNAEPRLPGPMGQPGSCTDYSLKQYRNMTLRPGPMRRQFILLGWFCCGDLSETVKVCRLHDLPEAELPGSNYRPCRITK